MCWNSSQSWHGFKGFHLGCSTHVLTQRSLGKGVGSRQKNNKARGPSRRLDPTGMIPQKPVTQGDSSLPSFPISRWPPQSILLVLGFSTGPMMIAP